MAGEAAGLRADPIARHADEKDEASVGGVRSLWSDRRFQYAGVCDSRQSSGAESERINCRSGRAELTSGLPAPGLGGPRRLADLPVLEFIPALLTAFLQQTYCARPVGMSGHFDDGPSFRVKRVESIF